MSTITNTDPNITYTGLLTVGITGSGSSAASSGLTGSLKSVQDGLGNSSALGLSTAGVAVTGTFTLNGSSIVFPGNVTIIGAHALTVTLTADTAITLPTSGTLYGTATGSITSLQLKTSLSDETGSGAVVFATSPTLVTPLLGTPTSGVLTSCTGYPVASLANLGTGVATFLTTPSSANLAAAVTDETGSGALVFASNPTITTPIITTIRGTNNQISATFNDVATVADYLNINSGTAGAAAITLVSSSTNANFAIKAKGTGAIFLGGSGTTVPAVLYDGSHNVALSIPSLTADRVITFPDTSVSCFIVQRVSTQTGAVATGTTALPIDDTIPQIAEGDQYMSLAITPKNTANKLKIDIVFFGTGTNVAPLGVALFQDSTSDALAAGYTSVATSGAEQCIKFTHTMSAGTVSATTFKVRAGQSAGTTTTFNGTAGGRIFGGVLTSSITITEYSS